MLSIIIITYNSSRCIASCLDSIFQNQVNFPFNIILIDNDSKDKAETKKIISVYQKNNIFILDNNENLGFAKAVNQGIKYAKQRFNSNYFLLLNPDATLKDDCLAQLKKTASQNEALGLLSAKIVNPQNSAVWFSHAYIDWLSFKTKHSPLPTAPFNNNSALQKVSYLTGCCLLIKNTTIEKIGFFDERFFLYYEDADFSLRAQQAGFKIATDEKSVCYHIESQSSTSKIKNYFLAKNGPLFFEKHCRSYVRAYFWLIYWLRFFYHKYFSHKTEIYEGLRDFRAEIKK